LELVTEEETVGWLLLRLPDGVSFREVMERIEDPEVVRRITLAVVLERREKIAREEPESGAEAEAASLPSVSSTGDPIATRTAALPPSTMIAPADPSPTSVVRECMDE
jgi:hypothetical protein